jgi:hypothetical protein
MAIDRGLSSDLLAVRASSGLIESGGHSTLFQVEKWDDDQMAWTSRKLGLRPRAEPGARHFRAARVKPFEVYEKDNANLLTNGGWNLLMKNVAGSAGTLFSGSVGRIGSGDSSTTPAYTDTALNAATNKVYNPISATPTVGSTQAAGLVFAATFATGDANWSWQEFGVDQGTSQTTSVVAVFFSHGLATPGTKTSSQTWNVTVTIGWT